MREVLRDAVRLCPALKRGGLSVKQLRLLAAKWGQHAEIPVAVDFRPWPFSGSVQRVGRHLVIVINSAQDEWHRRHALAHELGHLFCGHYDLEEAGVWFLSDGPGANEWEAEADAFASFVLRSQGLPAEWYI